MDQKHNLRSSDQALERVMNYHVIPGHMTTRQMVGDNMITTLKSSSTVNIYSSTKVYTHVRLDIQTQLELLLAAHMFRYYKV